MLMSVCNPNVSRIVSSVVSCGFPSPRSMLTIVLTATPAKSASVCWLIPSFFRLSRIVFPISCCVIFPICCDFVAKIVIFLQQNNVKSQFVANFEVFCLLSIDFCGKNRNILGNLISDRFVKRTRLLIYFYKSMAFFHSSARRR